MDPNATLTAIRTAITDLDHTSAVPSATAEQFEEAARRLAEHVEALDAWIARGGFLPDAWCGR